MKTSSLSVSPASTRAQEIISHLRLPTVAVLCGLVAFASFPWMKRHWAQTAGFVDQLQGRAQGPLAPLPNDDPARQLAGWNGR